ncbi:hypothetical protein H0H92_015026 [Tricholoma furcatifolium]|nr:hypothetical protein H0H92_015026 [Tricholoma furcatifolium]
MSELVPPIIAICFYMVLLRSATAHAEEVDNANRFLRRPGPLDSARDNTSRIQTVEIVLTRDIIISRDAIKESPDDCVQQSECVAV